MTPAPEGGRLRVVAVADTDSYVKWAAALVADPRVDGSLVVVDTELVVTDAQLEAALAGTDLDPSRARRAAFDELPARLAGADVVLAAAPGPLVRVVAREAAKLSPRPVIATGLPGISIPATWKALHFRRQCDMFVLHSHREIRAFGELAAERGIPQRFALARLPFVKRAEGIEARGTDLVFAAQALVPRARDDRLRLAALLIEAARAEPAKRVVVKLRGRPGEAQTHFEQDPFTKLIDEIGGAPANLVVSYAPMGEALATAEGLMTVSSTAAIEAAAQGVPVIALDSFGVTDKLINVVFEGSGLLAGDEAVVGRAFRLPDPAWVRDNYFHDPADDTWIQTAERLVARRRLGELPPSRVPFRLGGELRDVWERRLALGDRDRSLAGRVAYRIGVPLREVVRVYRRLATRIRSLRYAKMEG
ncbi:DUF6716 putative glycosyltransferase [Microbacterium indicum]|uniref:DUF6716 putative glycosyltransferase n=1 Tax=Microbacterium indicum TaxID=358100 RepID=UPI000416A26E|nr:DUF6716 putative glycosyltransferase [Microbacterium indicum]